MEKFADLMLDNSSAGDIQVQRELDRRFYALLADSGFNHWIYGDPFPLVGRRILLGLTNYSEQDLNLLDSLRTKLAEYPTTTDRIDVFCIGEYKTLEARAKCLPGLDRYQTPVVGIWQDGDVEEKAYGADGRKLIMELYDL
jgi:hypothetical protein